jgi:PKD repeat protein
MKSSLKAKINMAMIIFFIGIISFSCEYETDIRDAEFPDQLLYMPAAYNNGLFIINDIARERGELPFEGHPFKYVVDLANKKFIVPLSVYRSGINNTGEFSVNIEVDTDTIVNINAAENYSDSLSLIPDDKYSIVNSVEMKDGEEIAQFDLAIELDYLRNNYPDKIFALGIRISSPQRETNPNLSTTVVIIHTEIIKPTADFSVSIDERTVNFTNNSLMAEKYEWDFGDGSEISEEISPTHKYSSAGTYMVTLTALGITGEQDKSSTTIEITVP